MSPISLLVVVVIWSVSHVQLWDPIDFSMPGFPVLHQLLELAQTHTIELEMSSNHLILLSPSPPALSLYPIRVFSNELALCIRWPKYWSFSFSINPSNEYSRLISFRIDWFDVLAVQGTLKSLLQHHSLKASLSWLGCYFCLTFLPFLWHFPENT